MLLASEAYGKPYKAEELFDDKDKSSTEANRELSPLADINETSVFRGKRDASSADEYLKTYCPHKRPRSSLSGHPCEAGSFVCHNYVEIVCNSFSFACLSSIPKVGTAKCVPEYKWVTIDLGSLGKRQVRRTHNCTCA